MVMVGRLALCTVLAFNTTVMGVASVTESLTASGSKFLSKLQFSERPRKPFLGAKPGKDPVYRAGRWTVQTMRDLNEIRRNRLLQEHVGLWASTGFPVIMQTSGGGGGDGSNDSAEGSGSGGGPGQNGNGGGSNNSGSSSGGPSANVNTHNGNRLASYPLVGWSARGDLSVGFTAYHNSLGDYPGELGWGWSHSYEVKLNYTSGSSAIIRWADGTEVAFTESGGNFTPPPGFHDALVHNSGGTWTLTTKHQAKFEFRSDGHLVAIKDRAANQITISRDTSGKITTVTDPSSRTLTFSYNSTSGKLDSVTDPNSKTWSFARNSSGDLEDLTYPLLNSVSYTREFGYNSTHDITSETDLRGKVWTFNYDSGSRMTWWKTPSPLSEQTSYTYNSTNTVITHPGAQTVTHNYSSGMLASEVDEEAESNAYVWTTDKQLEEYTDKRGKVWEMTYDTAANRLTLKNPLNKTWTYDYNTTNDLESVEDPLNHTTTFDVNTSIGKVEEVIDAMSRTVRTNTYDTYGQLETTTNGASEETELVPNSNGDYTSVFDPLNNEATISYDTYGRPTGVETPEGVEEAVAYDDWGRATTITHGDASTVEVEYDPEGNVVSVTDELDRETVYAYDEAGRLLSVTNPESDVETYTYNSNGWLIEVENGRGKTRTYTHSSRGEVESLTMPDSTDEAWTYDESGNVKTYTNGLSQTITYNYDDAGRLTGVDYPTGTDTSFTYDDANRRTTMVDATGTTTWNYNDANQLTSIVQPNGSGGTYTVSFSPNAAGRRDSMTDPSGTTSYGYDGAGRLDELTNPLSEVTTWAYDDDSRVTRITYHTGAYDAYAYDTRGRLTSVNSKNSSNGSLRSRSYTYDVASQMLTQNVDSITTTYDYDDAGQLIEESRTGYASSYSYDGNGNRLSKTLGGVTEDYVYDDGDKLLEIKVGSTVVKDFDYDAAGRTTKIQTSGYTRNFSYDYESRVTQITGLATTNTFTYNGFDTRVKKVDSAGTSNYQRAGANVTSPVLSDSAATYTPGVSERRSGTTEYLHAGLKNADLQTNSSQANAGTKRYDAFGLQVGGIGTFQGPFGYAGKFGYQSSEDAEVMLLGHRYYDASTGRFLTRDPIRDGRNWYACARNKPPRRVDPNGTQSLELQRWGNQFIDGITGAWDDLVDWWSGADHIGPHGEPVRVGGWTAALHLADYAVTVNGTVHLNDDDQWNEYRDSKHWSAHEVRHIHQQEDFCGGSGTIFLLTMAGQYLWALGHDGAPFEQDADDYADELYRRHRKTLGMKESIWAR
ncbi:MAG TPA: RHS repeat-associated core domain-containing protein [Fimbriimonadaceae bacterium]|nr:RHS repeat-associated core domain-containing protein [Fimbriimonadaceae bacterium]